MVDHSMEEEILPVTISRFVWLMIKKISNLAMPSHFMDKTYRTFVFISQMIIKETR